VEENSGCSINIRYWGCIDEHVLGVWFIPINEKTLLELAGFG